MSFCLLRMELQMASRAHRSRHRNAIKPIHVFWGEGGPTTSYSSEAVL